MKNKKKIKKAERPDKSVKKVKAAQKKVKKAPKELTPEAKGKRTFIIFTSIFLSIVLLFGIIFGVIAIVRNVRAVMIYKEVTITKGVANYLVMMGKYNYMSSLAKQGVVSYDTPEFWDSLAPNGKTYGDILEDEVEFYLKKIMVATHLFDKYAELSSEDEKRIESFYLQLLVNFGGNRSTVDEELEKIGCDLDDVAKATEMIYKYVMARDVIFGYEGEALKSGDYDAQCDEFFSTYIHAKLLFIRTEDKFVKNSDTGEITTEELTDEEKAEINAKLESIRSQIANAGSVINKEDGCVILDEISEWAEKDEMNVVGGYYFATTSIDTDELMKAYPEVVYAVYATELYGYAEVETSWGVCFIYRDDPTPRAYEISSLDRFFTDFYSDAADYLYPRELANYAADVKVKKKFYNIDIIAVPYNYLITVKL